MKNLYPADDSAGPGMYRRLQNVYPEHRQQQRQYTKTKGFVNVDS